MVVFGVWIINKSGGLIYQRDFNSSDASISSTRSSTPAGKSLSTNDCLVLASTFQSVHAIATQVCPKALATEPTPLRHAASSGIETINWQSSPNPFKLSCYQSPTGVKFVLLSSPQQPQLDYLLKRLYECYADYCLKSPFQAPEMPIRAERFEHFVNKLIKQFSA